jgi:hypothetical protein
MQRSSPPVGLVHPLVEIRAGSSGQRPNAVDVTHGDGREDVVPRAVGDQVVDDLFLY